MAKKAATVSQKPVAANKPAEVVTKDQAPISKKAEVAAKPKAGDKRAQAEAKKAERAAKKVDSAKKQAESKKVEPAKEKKEIKLLRYFREVRAELRNVIWPTRRAATNLTLIVLAVTTSMSIFLGMIDWLLTKLFTWVISL